MVQKYQNESAPIFYYGKSPKTNRKHIKNILFTSPDPRLHYKNDTVFISGPQKITEHSTGVSGLA